ncbi:HAD-IB family hydrolase [Streptomyces sp. NPDC096191]|uniref:HAD family hydrolase n=1 Tax=Streptomyces sp. NPDC096191 TaxID=3155426 RepID=UPI003323379E
MTATSRSLVFCDVDETLITDKSMLSFLRFYFTRRHGRQGDRHAESTCRRLAGMLSSGVPRAEANRAYYEAWKGRRAAEVAQWGIRWLAIRQQEGGFYVERTRTEILRHRANGAGIVLVSGSFPAVLDPIAADIGARHLLCSRPEVREGVFTGRLQDGPVIAEGKRMAMHSLLAHYPHIRPSDCHAYGDHVSDLPMLKAVGHPTVVGEDPQLLAALPGARAIPVP